MASFSKFVRPETPSRGVISERDLHIIEAVLREDVPFVVEGW
jgi:hypothetical protein